MLRSIYFAAVCSDSRTFLLARLLGDVRALIRRSPIARRAFPWSLVFTRIAFNVPLEFLLRGKNPCMLGGLLGWNIAGMGSGSRLLLSLFKLVQRLSCRSCPTFRQLEGRIFGPNFVQSGTNGVWAIFGLFKN